MLLVSINKGTDIRIMELPKIAIVDDDEISLELIATIIESNIQVDVVCFSSSAEALKFLLQQNGETLQMVISDMKMPEYDGLALLRTCREQSLAIPFLFMTAFESRQTRALAKQLGAVDYLVKPINKDNLLSILKQHTDFTYL